jgi:Domain of unknown function (DUF6458)
VGIGASIFLIALGAILTFALNVDIGAVDIDVIGWILMAVGALGLVVTILIWGRRRQVVTTTPVEEQEVVRRPVRYRRVEERRDVDPF